MDKGSDTGTNMKASPFEIHHERYDEWFEEHEVLYESELKAIKELVPTEGRGIEIGVGSGRFSAPLSIEYGLDPSQEMLRKADERGIRVIRGIGEELPFEDESFDFALIVTTICFFEEPLEALKETVRILRPGGTVVIGFIDKESLLGQRYQKRKEDNVFYSSAKFFSVDEVIQILEKAGFSDLSFVQTLFGDLEKNEFEEAKKGYGEGSFVVITAEK